MLNSTYTFVEAMRFLKRHGTCNDCQESIKEAIEAFAYVNCEWSHRPGHTHFEERHQSECYDSLLAKVFTDR